MFRPPRLHAWLASAVLLALLAPAAATAQGIEKPRVPLRTALDEIRTLREAYQKAYNEKDAAAVANMYLPDAIAIEGDGTVLSGKDAIGSSFHTDEWTTITIKSDTVRVFSNTALDVGTVTTSMKGGGENTSHYLVVLRRGLQDWKLLRTAVVPEAHMAKAGADSAH